MSTLTLSSTSGSQLSFNFGSFRNLTAPLIGVSGNLIINAAIPVRYP